MPAGIILLFRWIDIFALRTCQLAILLMTTLVFTQVVMRYMLGEALVWAEEGSVFLMIWVTFVGAGVAFRRGAHVAVTILPDRLPLRGARVLRAITYTLILVFLAVVVWQGWELSRNVMGQRSAALGVPMSWPYLMVPFGCILLFAQVIASMVDPIDMEAETASSSAQAEV